MNDNKLTTTINKTRAEVFAFCIKPPNVKIWATGFINETTNEWPAKVGTVYTEYKNDNTSFKIIVTDYKENNYIAWKTEDGDYQIRYTFTPIDQATTRLTYVETGNVDNPFTQEELEKLQHVIENE